MNNQEKRIRKDFKKEKRVYISSWVIFVYYIRESSSGGKQKYLAIFAVFCEHEKTLSSGFFVLFCGLMK